MQTSTIALTLLSLCGTSFARPAPDATITAAPSLEDRGLISDLEGIVGDILGDAVSSIDGVFSKVEEGKLSGSAAWSSVKSAMTPVTATTTQTNVASAMSSLSSIHSANPSANVYDFVAAVVAEGLTADSVVDILDTVEGLATGDNSMSNVNSKSPSTTIYPKKGNDPEYSNSESTLRAAIHIPSNFTYGKVPPVILMPGTGATGYLTFVGNFIPLLSGSSYADPVWLNIPGYMLDDAQSNSEFAAYAINYINGITSQNVSIIGWSQGNIDIQWAFKYFNSTRSVTSNHIAISPDYAGTENANLICPSNITCDPSVIQQKYMGSSNYIDTLRRNNGDSAYVPTTTLYSGLYDEIVEPQQGTGASAFLNDVRNVGVTNNYVQSVCSGLPGGSFYTHESMLANPISFALAKDALTNGGPGQTSRVDLTTVCNEYLAPGLNIGDFLLTENSILVAAIALITYTPKTTTEPVIKSYATY